jgi:hypothetical protein
MKNKNGLNINYMDLMIKTLMEHEKNMDRLIEKTEKISEDLRKILEKTR